jgi:hypothetical protein
MHQNNILCTRVLLWYDSEVRKCTWVLLGMIQKCRFHVAGCCSKERNRLTVPRTTEWIIKYEWCFAQLLIPKKSLIIHKLHKIMSCFLLSTLPKRIGLNMSIISWVHWTEDKSPVCKLAFLTEHYIEFTSREKKKSLLLKGFERWHI